MEHASRLGQPMDRRRSWISTPSSVSWPGTDIISLCCGAWKCRNSALFRATASSPPDFVVSSATMAEDRPWEGNRRRSEIRPYKIRSKLFRPLASEDASSERRWDIRGRSIYSPVSFSTFSAAEATATLSPEPTISTAIDDGYNEGPKGTSSITMTAPNAITRFQDAYVEKVIDTLERLTQRALDRV